MSEIAADISISVDGFVDAGRVTAEEPMGPGGDALHQWLAEMDATSASVMEREGTGTGAVICGRRTYDLSAPWWGAHGPTGPTRRLPVIVLSHATPDDVPEDSVYTFCSGVRDALSRAEDEAAGRDITIMGGASTIDQFLAAGLVDRIMLHQAPVLLGEGTRLFSFDMPGHLRLEPTQVDVSPAAVHLLYRVNG